MARSSHSGETIVRSVRWLIVITATLTACSAGTQPSTTTATPPQKPTTIAGAPDTSVTPSDMTPATTALSAPTSTGPTTAPEPEFEPPADLAAVLNAALSAYVDFDPSARSFEPRRFDGSLVGPPETDCRSIGTYELEAIIAPFVPQQRADATVEFASPNDGVRNYAAIIAAYESRGEAARALQALATLQEDCAAAVSRIVVSDPSGAAVTTPEGEPIFVEVAFSTTPVSPPNGFESAGFLTLVEFADASGDFGHAVIGFRLGSVVAYVTGDEVGAIDPLGRPLSIAFFIEEELRR